MKKLSKIMLNHVTVLKNNEMSRVVGGSNENTYSYFLRCYQEKEEGYYVNDCERITAIQYCGVDLKDVVCVAVNTLEPSNGQ